jgi:hypothetical protein
MDGTTVELVGGKHDGKEVVIPTLSGTITYDGEKYRHERNNWNKIRDVLPCGRAIPTALYVLQKAK